MSDPLHTQRLDALEKEAIKQVQENTKKFDELKGLLLRTHDSAAKQREKMFSLFDQRLHELKADFKDHYQTQAAAEKSQSTTIKVIVGGFFSVGTIILTIVKLFMYER